MDKLNKRFPQSPKQHKIDRLGDALLQTKLASKFILNPYSKDYGLDYIADIIQKGEIPGISFRIQLKSHQSRKIHSNKTISQPVEKVHWNLWKNIIEPVILCVADISKEKVYWINLKKVNIKFKEHQETATIKIPIINELSSENSLNELINGVIVNKMELTKKRGILNSSFFNFLLEKDDTLKIIIHQVKPSGLFNKFEIKQIQLFWDEINTLLDNDFIILKNKYFIDSWKIGIFITKSSNKDGIKYAFFPISRGSNIPPIIEVTPNVWISSHLPKILPYNTFNVHDPKKNVLKEIEFSLKRLFKTKALNHQGSRFLALEYVFAVIDKYWKQLGLEKKDEYTISEVEDGLFQYLPLWVEESLKAIPRESIQNIGKNGYLNLDLIRVLVPSVYEKMIESRVNEKLRHQKTIYVQIPVDSREIPLKLMDQFLTYLKKEGITNLTRHYRPPNFSRVKKPTEIIWNGYNLDDIIFNLQTFFHNLVSCYYTILENNFPKLQDKLTHFYGASKIIVEVELEEKYGPMKRVLYLKNEAEKELSVSIISKSEGKIPDDYSQRKTLLFNEKQYQIISWSSGVLDFIFHELPMLDTIYKILLDKIGAFFNFDTIGVVSGIFF